MTIKDEMCPQVKADVRLLDDGTLWIKTDKIADIGRVIVEDGKTSCKQFYQDAQLERKKGKWISLDDFRGKYNDYGYKCSECGEQHDYEANFCSNCGADMREEKE